MASKHIIRYSIALIIKKVEIEISIRETITNPLKWLKLKRVSPLYMYNGNEQLSQWMVVVEAEFFTIQDNQGEVARLMYVVML